MHFVDYRWRVFFAKLLQKQLRTLLTVSLPCRHLPRPPSADRPSPWTAISRRLVSSAVCCRLLLSGFLCQLSLYLLSDLPFLLHFRSRGRSRAQAFLWVSRRSRQRDSLIGEHPHPTQWMATVSQRLYYLFFLFTLQTWEIILLDPYIKEGHSKF